VIWKNIFCHVKPESGHLSKDSSLLSYHVVQNDIETADTVSCYHDQAVAIIIDFAYLAFFDWL